jgi:hypothetical protein
MRALFMDFAGDPKATDEQLLAFAANFRSVLWGAWLQAVGPVLIAGFAVHRMPAEVQ